MVAAPTGTGKAHPDTEWAVSTDGSDRVETYLIKRVIPAVEGANRRTAAHRIISGFSMGGYGAANIALPKSALSAPEPRLPRDLGGWRREVVGEALLLAAAAPG